MTHQRAATCGQSLEASVEALRPRPRRAVFWVGGVLLCLQLVASSAAAQSGAGAGDYGALVDQGLAEFGEGNWREAYALFKQAHAIDANARTMRGLGMTAYNLRDYPTAVRHLKGSLESTRKPLTDELRTDVVDLLEKSSRLVGTVEVTLTPAAATLYANAEKQAERTVLLGVGKATLRAELQGHAPVERVILVEAGQLQKVAIELHPNAAVAAPAPEAAPTAAPEPGDRALTAQTPAEQSETGDSGVWLWVGVGAATVAAVVLGGVLLSGSADDGTAATVPAGNTGDTISASRGL